MTNEAHGMATPQTELDAALKEIVQLEAAIKKAFEQVYASYDSDTPYKDACLSVSDAFAPLGFQLVDGDNGRDICVRDSTAPATETNE